MCSERGQAHNQGVENAMERKQSGQKKAAGEQGTLCIYLRELHRIPLLDSTEEQSCARLAARGDREARQRLIEANLRFVILVAKRYRKCGVPLEDLINEGNIGLIQAAERFDPERGVHFVSYAIWWIRQAILKALHENSRLIRVPRSRAGELSRIEELRHDGLVQTGSEPRLAEIAEALAVEEEELVKLIQAAQRTLSLDGPATDMQNPESLGACLEDRNVPKPEEVLVGASLKEQLDSLLGGLSDREACILRDRFGLAGHKGISLLEAARKHQLSKERVRQIEKRALRKIRVSDGVQQLKIYAN
jgi:RNA polymerase primary sigma factor